MSERTVAEYRDPKLTGAGAMELYAQEEGRDWKPSGLAEWQFIGGNKLYKPVMMKDGWKVVVVKE